ncbi:MAG TPA: hypothetical protein VI248_05030 [Kineosporiaceae bacterium]
MSQQSGPGSRDGSQVAGAVVTEAPADGPDDVITGLRSLAAEPALTAQARVLHRLADVLATDPDLPGAAYDSEGWAELDLARIVDVSAPSGPGRVDSRRRTLLAVLPTVLAFLPVLTTWVGLGVASTTYRGLRTDPAWVADHRGQGFLELWQSGFDGHLPTWCRFDVLGGLVGVSVSLVMVLAVLNGWLRRTDELKAEQAAESLRTRVSWTLTLAQVELNRRRLHSPARFAAELMRAADELRRLQRQAADLAQRNSTAAVELTSSAARLGRAAAQLRDGGGEVRSAVVQLEQTVGAVRTQVIDQISGSARHLQELAAEAAAGISAATQQIGPAARSAADALREIQQTGRSELAALVEGAQATSTRSSALLEETSRELQAAAREHAVALARSSVDAAATIGATYQDAVAAAAVQLADHLDLTSARIESLVERLERGASGYQAASARTAAAAVEHTRAVAEGVSALRTGSAELRSAVGDLSDGMTGLHSGVRELHEEMADAATGVPPLRAELAQLHERLSELGERMARRPDPPVRQGVRRPTGAPTGSTGRRRKRVRSAAAAVVDPPDGAPGRDTAAGRKQLTRREAARGEREVDGHDVGVDRRRGDPGGAAGGGPPSSRRPVPAVAPDARGGEP